MSTCCKDADVLLGLKLITTLGCGFYTGGCAAIAFVTQPAVNELDDENCLLATKGMLKRAKPLPISHLIASTSGVAAYVLSKRTCKDKAWLAGVVAFGTLIPFTAIMIGPINKRVLKDGDVDELEVKPLLTKWLTYHRIRTVAALGIFGYFAYTLSARK